MEAQGGILRTVDKMSTRDLVTLLGHRFKQNPQPNIFTRISGLNQLAQGLGKTEEVSGPEGQVGLEGLGGKEGKTVDQVTSDDLINLITDR